MPTGLGGTVTLVAALTIMMLAGPTKTHAAGKADPLVAGIKTYEKGQHTTAVKHLTAAFNDKGRSRSDTATALYYRGKAYLKLQKSAAALLDLKAALWLKQLSPSNRADAEQLQAGIMKAAKVETTASVQPAQKAAPTQQSAGNRSKNWATTTKKWPTPKITKATSPKPRSWRDVNRTVTRRKLPSAVRILPTPPVKPVAPLPRREEAKPLVATKLAPQKLAPPKFKKPKVLQPKVTLARPALPRFSKPKFIKSAAPAAQPPKQQRPATKWSSRTIKTAAPILTGSVAAKATRPAPPPRVRQPTRSAPKKQATVRTKPTRPATVSAITPPVPRVRTATAQPTTPDQSMPAHPSASLLTYLFDDTASPMGAQATTANQLRKRRMERVRTHNAMRRARASSKATAN